MSATPRRRSRNRLRWWAYNNALTLLVFVVIAIVAYGLLVWEANRW